MDHCQEVSATPSKCGTKGKREFKNLECSINFESYNCSKGGRGICQYSEVLGCVVGGWGCLLVVYGRFQGWCFLMWLLFWAFVGLFFFFLSLSLGVPFVCFLCT